MALLPLACAALPCACSAPQPPLDAFEITYELPQKPDKPAPEPPAAVLAPWRVWINQEQPMQKQNPTWHEHAAKEGAMLELAHDGHWRCLVTAAHVFVKYGEHARLREWTTSRSIRCSNDGWRTDVEGYVRSGFGPDGIPTVSDPPAALYLHDLIGREERRTAVVLAPLHKQFAPRPDLD